MTRLTGSFRHACRRRGPGIMAHFRAFYRSAKYSASRVVYRPVINDLRRRKSVGWSDNQRRALALVAVLECILQP